MMAFPNWARRLALGGLAARGGAVTACGGFGDDSKYATGRMAGLRGAGSDVASLGGEKLAWAVSF